MTRAEEAALKAYPIQFINMYTPLIVKIDINKKPRKLYQKAYEQAEKDLALTWEDIRIIGKLWINTPIGYGLDGESLSREVLRRFNESKSK